jgi:quercetin dioxygenase-like cupin family protein
MSTRLLTTTSRDRLRVEIESCSRRKRKEIAMNAIRKRAVAALAAFAAVGAVVAALLVVPALATPPSGVTQQVLGRGQLAEVHAKASATPDWWAKIETKGGSDLITALVTIQPGGTLGWHSHPGFDIATVVSGTATYYEANDPTCTPRVVTAGQVRFNLAGDVHILRNEGTVPLVLVANLLVPHGAAPRIDQPDPGNCPF